MKKETIKKIVLFFTLLITLITPFIIFYPNLKNLYKSLWHKKIKPKITQVGQEKWITIFTHGAFGSVLGLLNTFEVIKDNIKGTRYKKLIGKMRKNPHFYTHQPILQKGLVKIKPSFELSASKNNKYAAYPIIKAYETILQEISPAKEQNFFYTFGWSGLMSQNQRRKEAIRFYNALNDEISKYSQMGINPKIRIIAHSHGGNLALNLAAVKTCLNNLENKSELEVIAINDDEKESLLCMMQRIKNLPTKENVKTKKGQKVFDYIPIKKDLVINELIMFGTPIQAETEYFAFHDLFQKVYNFYSEEDIVQKMDWITTKKYYSEQRLSLLDKIKGKIKDRLKLPKVIQVKIMMEREVITKKLTEKLQETDTILTLTTNPIQKNQSFWRRLLDRAKGLWQKATSDPTHRELWFASWDKKDMLSPLPTVIFTPIMVNAIEKISEQIDDLDLNICFTGQTLTFYVLKHNDAQIRDKVSIYRKIIEKIKSKIKKWKPDDLSFAKEFDIINRYSNNL